MTAAALAARLLESTGLFVSAVLTPESRQRLLERVPPVHTNVEAHHVTIAYNPSLEVLEKYLGREGERLRIPVTGVAVDSQAQAVLVGADSENDYPHITISVADGANSRYSNQLLAQGDIQHISVFTVEGIVTIEPI